MTDRFDDLPSLRALGEDLAAVAARDAAAATATRARRRRRSPWGRRPERRLVPILACLVLAVAGAAVAATALLREGSPAPRNDKVLDEAIGAVRPGTSKVLSVRVPDPDGGAPWGLETFVTARYRGCAQVGRVFDGHVGLLGRDGAFGDDGLFHRLSVGTGFACGGVDAKNRVFVTAGSDLALASGQQEHIDCAAPGEKAAHPLPACPVADERSVYYGLAGPQAVRVDLSLDGIKRSMAVRPADNGAYLFVLRGTHAETPRDIMAGAITVRYRGGLVCPRDGIARCRPAPGFAQPAKTVAGRR